METSDDSKIQESKSDRRRLEAMRRDFIKSFPRGEKRELAALAFEQLRESRGMVGQEDLDHLKYILVENPPSSSGAASLERRWRETRCAVGRAVPEAGVAQPGNAPEQRSSRPGESLMPYEELEASAGPISRPLALLVEFYSGMEGGSGDGNNDALT